ncbi:MAG: hypothetical protein FWD27_02745 [Coriobacteriia bacterium]|nr:hypothetical protein [Coriobacteriia bacterium]
MLAQTYSKTGNAVKAREGYISFLNYVDADISMVSAVFQLREVMEDMYTKACHDMGQLAISYDEYFLYIKKIETVRQHTQNQRAQMEAVQSNRNSGASWSDNIYQLAELELTSVESGDLTRLSYAASMFSLYLAYPQIDPPIDVLRIAIVNYSSFICKLVGESILYCAAKKQPANPDNYRFIYDTALALVSEYLDDMETHDAAKEALDKLTSAMGESVDKLNFHNNGYASVAPSDAHDFTPPLLLQEQMKQTLSTPDSSTKPSRGCVPAAIILLLAIAAIITVVVKFLL